jgi:hypothetical protein
MSDHADRFRQALAHDQRAWPNTDHATQARQTFVQAPETRQTVKVDTYDSREAKVAALRLRMHREGRALAGEDAEAGRMGWKLFTYHPNKDYPEQK